MSINDTHSRYQLSLNFFEVAGEEADTLFYNRCFEMILLEGSQEYIVH